MRKEVTLWGLERNPLLSYQLTPLFQTTPDPGQQEPQGTPFLPCLRGSTDCPHQLPSPSPPAPGQLAGRTRGGQHTFPTRPEINISRETELVLSVFTAKSQAGGWGKGQAEEPHPEPKASSPALPQAHCVPPSQPLALSEPSFHALGLGCPQPHPV